MFRNRWWHSAGVLATVMVVVFGAVGATAGGQTAGDDRDSVIARQAALIAEQQELIDAQEALLNEYRCLFGIDTHIVPGGCPKPTLPTPSPTPTASPTPSATPTPTEDPTSVPAVPSGTTEEQWEKLRQCVSNGDYQHVNPNGINLGAYEFRQPTWDNLARRHYPRLVGVKPSDAAPNDQDRMAYRLYEERGWAPWPSCGASLRPGGSIPTDPTVLPPVPAGTTKAQWDQLIQCESGGDYRAYNPAGPYLGAFQFNQGTWDGVAGRHYPNLVGVDPRDASPADQHRMAYRLYEERGWQPWPTCGRPFHQG